jgi:hypothetical protein
VRAVTIYLVWRSDLRAPAALRRLVEMLEAQRAEGADAAEKPVEATA